MTYNPRQWHEHATRAGFLCGVADDHTHTATTQPDLTMREVCRALDQAEAALASAQRELTRARAFANEAKEIME